MQRPSETEAQIYECLDLLKNVLGEDLLGVYLYGSSIVGGLQKYSDIDILVISNRLTTADEKNKLATAMLSISGVYLKSTKRPLELTIAVKSEINPWSYPPKFDFQYGDWLRKDFESGNIEPWPSKEMPDLALLLTQVMLAHEVLFGPPPSDLIQKIPYRDFITASTKEMGSLLADLQPDTRNVLLTFARIWSTVATDAIRSKSSAALWAIERLPQDYKPVIERAHEICMGREEDYWDDMQTLTLPCAEFMIEKINQLTSNLSTEDYANRSVKLAE